MKVHSANVHTGASVYTDMGVALAASMLGRVDALPLVEGSTPREMLAAMDTTDKLTAVLNQFSEEDLDAAIARLPILGKMVPRLRANLLLAVRSLPHDPGGRPRKVREQEKGPMRMRVAELDAQGVPLRDAQQRVADHEGVSLRTIQRIWASRKIGSRLL